jgi:hypothetical protein
MGQHVSQLRVVKLDIAVPMHIAIRRASKTASEARLARCVHFASTF